MPSPEKKTLEEIMRDIYTMQQASNKKPEVKEEEIKEYIQNELENKAVDKNSKVAKHITELMARNPMVRKELKASLPQADKARKEKMNQLRTDAKRSGMSKLWNDFSGRKKRNAKKELKEIAQAKRKSVSGDKLHKSASDKISTGRGRHIFTSMVNEQALGTFDERHNNKFTYKEDKNTKIINHRTSEGMLNGAVHSPAPEKDTGKVVLFFSGSGAPSAKFVNTVLQEYLDMGATVVSMDYRGFGKSETLDRKGKKKGTPLSENSIYQDGQEMLNYVMKEMNVKPENIILHGYSMGGAVASKVAADFAQTQQKNALETGRNVKKLGGVVLHSPMATMYEAAYEETIEGKERTFGNRFHAGFMAGGGKMFGGAYNTRSHMRRLRKFDPDMPVHYTSGDYNAGDQLALDVTNIDKDKQAHFKNSSSNYGDFDHEGRNLDINNGLLKTMINGTRKDVPVQKQQQPQQQRESNAHSLGI